MIIYDARYLISSPDLKDCPEPDRPEYAFIGRSNVGKSSLINLIADRQHLAKTSATPGKTRLINHFVIESGKGVGQGGDKKKHDHWYLVDLPGYGFAKVSQQQRKDWQKLIRDYIRKRTNLVNLFVLIDSRHRPQSIDLDFINQLGEWQVPFTIVFTKADKETQKTVSEHVRAFLQELEKTWEALPPYFITSAVKRTGREKILSYIADLNEKIGIKNKG